MSKGVVSCLWYAMLETVDLGLVQKLESRTYSPRILKTQDTGLELAMFHVWSCRRISWVISLPLIHVMFLPDLLSDLQLQNIILSYLQ